MRHVMMICRAAMFSPNSVEKDRAILEAVGALLHKGGYDVRFVSEEALSVADNADMFFSMGRLPSTLTILKRKERAGMKVVNSAYGVERCARRCADELMRGNGIPAAPLLDEARNAPCGYWLKRADMSAQSPDDVRYARDMQEARRLMEDFNRRGITDVLATEHVEGDVVKFYGVAGTPFFRTFYPTDDNCTKFGDEERNGKAHHYYFDKGALRESADKMARITGVQVYGGDCIVRADGSFAIIDFNDWPSFSRCREEAAEAIAGLAF